MRVGARIRVRIRVRVRVKKKKERKREREREKEREEKMARASRFYIQEKGVRGDKTQDSRPNTKDTRHKTEPRARRAKSQDGRQD